LTMKDPALERIACSMEAACLFLSARTG